MKINNHSCKLITAQSPKTESAPAGGPIAPVPPVTNTPKYSASSGELHTKLQAMPDIDHERVAAIKAAIQAKEIKLDSADIANAMLNYHRS